jgi:hypothetical protein
MPRMRWSRDRIIRAIRTRHASGLPVSSGLVCRQANALYSIARYYFDSWPLALKAAGIPYEPPTRWTRSKLLEVLAPIARTREYLGYARIDAESKRLGKDLRRAIRKHFGSLGAVQVLLGVPTRLAWSRQRDRRQVFQGLKKHSAEGRLAYGRIYELDRPLISACRRAFGTWTTALDAAGIPPHLRPTNRGALKYTRQVVIKILKESWSNRDVRVASLRDKYSGIYQATLREFGSWNAGLKAAGIPEYAYSSRMASRRVVLGRAH